MISDNAKIFKATGKWPKDLQQNADINTMITKQQVEWRFSLSRTPWWGGFFERMVGLTKNALYKSLGRSRLPFEQLKEVLLESVVILNNRPLGCLEDDTSFLP